MEKLLFPVRKLFNQLSIIQKFSLMFVLYLIPITFIGYYVVSEHNKAIALIRSESEGLKIIHALTPLIINTAKYRGLTHIFLNGDNTVKTRIETLRSRLDQYWKDTEQEIALLGDDEITRLFQQDKKSWQHLKPINLTLPPSQIFDHHSKIISSLLKLISLIEEKSKLFLDPDLENAFIINIYTRELPALIENIGKARGLGAGILAKHQITTEESIKVSNFLNNIRNLKENIHHNLSQISQLNAAEKIIIERFEQSHTLFLNTASKNVLQSGKPSSNPEQFFKQGTASVQHSLALLGMLYLKLNKRIQQQKSVLSIKIIINFISTLALLLGSGYFFVAFYANLKRSIKQIHTVLKNITQGNLTDKVNLESKDELRFIANDINKMISSFRTLVSQVHKSTEKVLLSSKQNTQLSDNTLETISQQNIEIEQVATAMNEMSSTVHDVAQNAENTASATNHADNESIKGKIIVEKSIESIQSLSRELKTSSETINQLQKHALKIGSVLDVIQEIANQTNLLALNAAIEAARAGESGRGFAVVADEVRTLAGKTQESTEQIRTMIETLQKATNEAATSMTRGNEQSEITVIQANEAGAALAKIADAMNSISKMSEQIASAAVEQSTVAEEINRNIFNVKKLSDSTNNNAEETVANSEQLLQIAEELRSQITQFKIT